MSETAAAPPRRRRAWPAYLLTVVATAGVTFVLAGLLMNIAERKREAKEHYVKVVDLDEDTIDPAVWGRNFPRQYDGYLLTAEDARAPRGGSDALPPSRLDADPRLRRIFAGYPLSVDYREKRAHA